MDDKGIVQLYWSRDEEAIQATDEKYGRYCKSIAKNILNSDEDAEECVNDTYLNAWNAIPPHRPARLSAFLGRLTRNLSFNRYKRDRAEKRGGGEFTLTLEELADCVSGRDDMDGVIDRRELSMAINTFVKHLPAEKRKLFVCRYWYADPVARIAADCGKQPGSVSKTLERTRKQLKAYLTERGFVL